MRDSVNHDDATTTMTTNESRTTNEGRTASEDGKTGTANEDGTTMTANKDGTTMTANKDGTTMTTNDSMTMMVTMATVTMMMLILWDMSDDGNTSNYVTTMMVVLTLNEVLYSVVGGMAVVKGIAGQIISLRRWNSLRRHCDCLNDRLSR